jgi:hypothetical protein
VAFAMFALSLVPFPPARPEPVAGRLNAGAEGARLRTDFVPLSV